MKKSHRNLTNHYYNLNCDTMFFRYELIFTSRITCLNMERSVINSRCLGLTASHLKYYDFKYICVILLIALLGRQNWVVFHLKKGYSHTYNRLVMVSSSESKWVDLWLFAEGKNVATCSLGCLAIGYCTIALYNSLNFLLGHLISKWFVF